jgi:hypothetical protein
MTTWWRRDEQRRKKMLTVRTWLVVCASFPKRIFPIYFLTASADGFMAQTPGLVETLLVRMSDRVDLPLFTSNASPAPPNAPMKAPNPNNTPLDSKTLGLHGRSDFNRHASVAASQTLTTHLHPRLQIFSGTLNLPFCAKRPRMSLRAPVSNDLLPTRFTPVLPRTCLLQKVRTPFFSRTGCGASSFPLVVLQPQHMKRLLLEYVSRCKNADAAENVFRRQRKAARTAAFGNDSPRVLADNAATPQRVVAAEQKQEEDFLEELLYVNAKFDDGACSVVRNLSNEL